MYIHGHFLVLSSRNWQVYISGELARGVHNNYESTLHNNNIHVSGAGGNLYDLVIKGNHKGAAQD